MLVSGMETYLQKRFLELETEEWTADFDLLCSKIFSAKYLGQRKLEAEERAELETISKLEALFQTARSEMSFQEVKKVRRSYKHCYGIDLDEIIPAELMNEIDKYVHYRHRIIHAAADLSILNNDKVPPEEPEFAKKETLEKAKSTFVLFIEKFQAATLTKK